MARYSRNEAKEWAKENIRGIFTAPCLPETNDLKLDEAGLRRDISHYLDVIKVGGLYIHGFYGHFWMLQLEERKRAIEVVIDEVRGRVPVSCRCAHQNPYDAIELIKHAEAAGADMISLIGPWPGGSADTIYRYFEMVAASTNLGISIFNTHQAGYVISPELMARLADIPNVCALKDGVDISHSIQVRKLVGDRIVVIDPSEESFLVNLTMFGQQAIYTNTNSMYDSARATPMRDYVQAALRGDHKLAGELFYKMQPVRDLHRKWVNEPWRKNGVSPLATIKYWTSLNGLTRGATRPPLPELTREQEDALRHDLESIGWLETRQPALVG